MARPSDGTLHTHTLADGTRAFHLRVRYQGQRPRIVLHERPACPCGCGGGWDEPAARTELGNILARIRVGVWTPPQPPEALDPHLQPGRVPTFHEHASWWLDAKTAGALGDKPIAQNTAGDYRWRLTNHLLPYFGHLTLDQIDARLCQQFKADKLAEAHELRSALDAGADLRDRRGRKLVPLSAASLHKLVTTLAAILDEAVEDGHIPSNPARGKRLRIKVPKPKRTFLEMDELAAVLDAAAAQDAPLHVTAGSPAQQRIAPLLARGLRPRQIADALGLAAATVSYHLRRMGADVGRGYIGRKVICEILGRSGVRASELCDLKIGRVRLHDPDGARFHVDDAKTETGIREVQMTPDLVEAVIEHIDRLRRAGQPTGPDDYLVPNLAGGRISRQRVRRIVTDAATQASRALVARGLPPLPETTPHTLRRTYISIALLANNFDVKWVMGQVGHADSKMTMDVYAQLEQRVDRSHGTNFDELINNARTRLQAHRAPVEAVPA